MQLTIDLHLKTIEVYKLFELKLSENRLFMDAVLHKVNCIDHTVSEKHPQVEQELQSQISKFTQQIADFEKILENNKNISIRAIDVAAQFHAKISITNTVGILLIEFIERYDDLIALIKLLYLAGCFDSGKAYYINLKHVKKMGNKILSNLLLSDNVKRHG